VLVAFGLTNMGFGTVASADGTSIAYETFGQGPSDRGLRCDVRPRADVFDSASARQAFRDGQLRPARSRRQRRRPSRGSDSNGAKRPLRVTRGWLCARTTPPSDHAQASRVPPPSLPANRPQQACPTRPPTRLLPPAGRPAKCSPTACVAFTSATAWRPGPAEMRKKLRRSRA
jgi:hypothetical protein